MRNVKSRSVAAAGFAAIGVVGLAACSSGDSGSSASPLVETSMAKTTTTTTMDPAADLVGLGCAGYAEQVPTGPGSVAGMAQDPVVVAASNNPLLTTLTSAVSGKLNPDVDLVDTLNSGQFTLFAPTDDAFGKLPAETIETLKTDSDLLSSILTYHVVDGQLSPMKVEGTHTTLQGDTVAVTGTGDDISVNESSTVVCGGVRTANATVYMIDTVLMPPAS